MMSLNNVSWVVWIVNFLLFVLFFGGIIALIVWAVVRLTKRDTPVVTQTPLDIAKERYAKGEINKEQFEQIKKDLS
jgi:putative membrane protein